MSSWPIAYSSSEKGGSRLSSCKKYNCPWGDCNDDPDNATGEKCPWVDCNRVNCKVPWHKPCERFSDPTLLTRLMPMVFCVGLVNTTFGTVLMSAIAIYSVEFNQLYSEHAFFVSCMSLMGLAVMTVGGLILMIAVLFNKRRLMWVFVVSSSFLCVYIFTLGVFMISFSMNDATNFITFENATAKPDMTKFITGKPFAIGVLTLLGSVIHFVGSLSVFTYYNLKYLYPVMFTHTTVVEL